MIIYEVTLHVEPHLVPGVEQYMRRTHVPAIFGTRCFPRIRFCQASSHRFRTTYEATDQAELDRYLRDHAPALRAAFIELFPTGVSVSRETWAVQEVWEQVLS
jgi:hypothetical protein